MLQTLRGLDGAGLERSCGSRVDAIRVGSGAPGLERVAVRLTTCAFARHRHDTYAVGITTAGVQRFWYRGALRTCLPGEVHVLHPDEVHDGGAATDDGFAYRILYVAPELIAAALDGEPLPFVAEPVHRPSPATRDIVRLLADLEEPIDELAYTDVVAAVADALRALAGDPGRPPLPVDTKAVEAARQHLAEHACEPTPAAELERLTGTDRFTLTRHFRRALGTTPDRYRTMRRLAVARAAIDDGLPLTQAAARAGFADQSHLTRQFKRAYGLTPGRWRALSAADENSNRIFTPPAQSGP
jgi:AraC-like DNA-binding protein